MMGERDSIEDLKHDLERVMARENRYLNALLQIEEAQLKGKSAEHLGGIARTALLPRTGSENPHG